MLCIHDKFSGEAPVIRVGRKLNSPHVLETLGEMTLERGTPAHIWSHDGPEFMAKAVR